jgi:hypothetical protein
MPRLSIFAQSQFLVVAAHGQPLDCIDLQVGHIELQVVGHIELQVVGHIELQVVVVQRIALGRFELQVVGHMLLDLQGVGRRLLELQVVLVVARTSVVVQRTAAEHTELHRRWLLAAAFVVHSVENRIVQSIRWRWGFHS